MKIHILGICGTFMGGLTRILIESGHKVTGSDNNFYPPMSDQLRELDVELTKGFEPSSMPEACLLYTSPSPRDKRQSRMPSSA